MDNISLTRIKQHFQSDKPDNIRKSVREELKKLGGNIREDQQIAIGVGSRGIDNLLLIVRETVNYIKEKKAEPFIVPAMGSHGGATAEGQKELLEDYGIREDQVGAVIRSSMEVVSLPRGNSPIDIFMDKNAYHSDGVILVNKIKPHTDFNSGYESGLTKMAVIGLGKQKGAATVHRQGVKGLSDFLEPAARQIFTTGKILGGIAVIENAYDETMSVHGLPVDRILEEEPGLLGIAKKHRPNFPVDRIDVLIIDRIGKNISGTGIDTNIIGRTKIIGEPEPEIPFIKAIIASDITPESHGNALGVGLADVITKRLYDKIDFNVTYANVITATFLERAKIPVVADPDRKVLDIAIRSSGYAKDNEYRIVRIKDTLHMSDLYVSDAVMLHIKERDDIEILETEIPLLDENGYFSKFG